MQLRTSALKLKGCCVDTVEESELSGASRRGQKIASREQYKHSRIYGSASAVHKEMTLKRKTGVFLLFIRVTDLPDHTPDLMAVIQ